MQHILNTIKVIVASVVLSMGLAVLFVGPNSTTYAAPRDEVCKGVNISSAGGGGGGSCNGNGSEITKVVTAAVNILSIIAGIAAVIMLIIAGLKYVTSNGDASSIASAKTSIIYAIVGLVVVALSQAIVQFVLKKAGGGGGTP